MQPTPGEPAPEPSEVVDRVLDLRDETVETVQCVRSEIPKVIVTFTGAAAGTWTKSTEQGGGLLPPGTYPAAGDLLLTLVYNCDGVPGKICGQYVFSDALGFATCDWAVPGAGNGMVISGAVGSGTGICGGGLGGLLVLCTADAWINTGDVALNVEGIGVCSVGGS